MGMDGIVFGIEQDPMAAEDHIHCLLLGSPGPLWLNVQFSTFWWRKTQRFFDFRLVELIDVYVSCLL
jgi:hypothetical protein